jgi:hypothetical protein
MSRKHLLLTAALALLLLEAVFIVAALPRPPAARIKPSMALADVEARFGRQADLDAPAGEGKRTRMWMTQDGPVPVEFGEDDRVIERGGLKGQPPSWPDSLCTRLGW